MTIIEGDLTRVAEDVVAQIDENELVALATELGSIYSPTGYEGPACDRVLEWMRDEGFNSRKVGVFEDRYNILGRIKGAGTGHSLERRPIWDPDARGTVTGLTLHHTCAHLHRACLEGVAFALRHNIEAGRDAGCPLDDVVHVGGAVAGSKGWLGNLAAAPFARRAAHALRQPCLSAG